MHTGQLATTWMALFHHNFWSSDTLSLHPLYFQVPLSEWKTVGMKGKFAHAYIQAAMDNYSLAANTN